ncbi:uncharacterized protein Z519_02506 [Cladophialophora bantiana CBS 173.52]|uniref:F-box domain-containing protein n=1 Tax=Cladophialophora bantiana (strain ATCC 10958 / CBS 173.52 / CDC B-1940 / NIH 8579) TaxID=1442370 RepID=A0A0D2IJZ0_CLAB1|nr:uncharacterized protein Z519_02506 [Cladophialophora bantiana CBS 173.52]KIW97114.1 hypothetical protein Z519_02506 [Cladophialophora bantiana CBS 173.52]
MEHISQANACSHSRPAPPSKSFSSPEGGDGESSRDMPDDQFPDNRKESSRVAVTEHTVDNRILPTLKMQHPTSLILKAKQRTSMPALLSSNKAHLERAAGGARKSAFLSILPHDLHYLLATVYVDFDTLLALRQTCRVIYEILPVDVVRRTRAKLVKESLENEERQYREYRSIYPRQRLGHLWDLLYAAFDFRLIERPARELRCYGCLEAKPLWCFVERMSNRGTGLGAKFARNRLCKDCMRRYRDIEGEWWKENWVKKSDTVCKSSLTRRLRRWVLEGQSLVNPAEEIGVCSSCGNTTFELWWGCVACFELEEQRRREEDLMEIEGFERKIAGIFEAWRVRKGATRRQRQASRDRRTRNWWAPSFNIAFAGGLAERKAALIEWRENRENKENRENRKSGSGPTKAKKPDSRWRALDQIPLPKSRREARCSSCWVPNCPRRMYILGLAYERPLPRERWCPGCKQEFDQRLARKGYRKWRMKMSTNERSDNDWPESLAWLFEEN